MTRLFNNMKLSALALAIALVAVASAQKSGGASGSGGSSASEEAALPPSLIPYLKKVNHMTIAHGVLMCLAFVIFMPTGAIVIRLGHFKGVVNVHAGIQVFAYMMALAGMGIGVWVAHVPTKFGRENQIHRYHPIIGLTIIAGLFFQPILGVLHHAVYVKKQRRSIWSTLHVWWGRVFMTFAFIQGGLGLKFANNTTGGKIAYGVVAGVIWLTWISVAVWHDLKKSRTPEIREKRMDSEEMTPTGQAEARSA